MPVSAVFGLYLVIFNGQSGIMSGYYVWRMCFIDVCMRFEVGKILMAGFWTAN